MNVVYWTNIPAPYMVERFSALAQRGNLRFEAWFGARSEADRSWSVDEATWHFRYRYLPGAQLFGHRVTLPVRLLRGKAPDLLVGLHADPAFLLAQPIAHLRGAHTAFWVTKTFDSWVRRRRWKEGVKRAVFSRIDAVLTTGPDGERFATGYGTPRNRIFVLPHFVDYDHFSRECGTARPRRDEVRAELGLRGVTFLYVGRLVTEKGIDYLLDAYSTLSRLNGAEVSLLVAGDGPDQVRLARRCRVEGLRNVVFSGFQQRTELPTIYAASDVLVFPTLGDPFGHVVEEAMSCGLPVISTSAAGEIRSRVNEGTNGFVVPPADGQALFDRMQLLAADRDTRERMGGAAARSVEGQTAERWAEAFERAAGQILSLPKASQGAPGP